MVGLSAAILCALGCGDVVHADEPTRSDKGLSLRASEVLTETTSDQHARARELAERVRSRNVALRASATQKPERLIVQFDEPLTPERSEQLVQAGLKLVSYLPTDAFVVDTDSADADALSQLDGVRWIGEFKSAWKIDPMLGRRPLVDAARIAERTAGRTLVVVTLFENANEQELLDVRTLLGAHVRWMDQVGGSWTLCASVDRTAVDRLAATSCVQFIEEAPELSVRSGGGESRWVVQSNVPNVTPLWDRGLTGAGQIIGLLDDPIDVAHCSFFDALNPIGPLHRKIVAYNGSPPPPSSSFPTTPFQPGISPHGTHVACIAVGDAGTSLTTRGSAYNARFVYAPVPAYTESSIVAALTLHDEQGAHVHSNSWGDETSIDYGSLTRGMDAFAYDHEDALIVVAATNLTYLRVPENAKNVLAVGATSDAPSQESWCSGGQGPTADGRRKPEVYAPGCSISAARSGTACETHLMSGTSMATPLVAAMGTLVREYFMSGYYPSGVASAGDAFTPSGALLRAVLINASVDLTNLGGYPGNIEGWGRLLTDRGVYFAGDSRGLVVRDVYNASGLSTGDFAEVRITKLNGAGGTPPIGAENEDVRITLVWTDPPAAVGLGGTGSAIVNDLDLEVVSPSGEVYLANTFNTSLGISAPGFKADRINTVEQVILPASADAGEWRVRVKAAAVNIGTQGYALVVSGSVMESAAPEPEVRISVTRPPQTAVAGEPIVVDASVRLAPGQTLAPGMPRLHARLASGAYIVTMMQAVGAAGNDMTRYRGLMDAPTCASMPEYFIEAATCGSASSITEPMLGEIQPHSVTVNAADTVLADDFEIDRGWVVGTGDSATAGQWVRVEPVGGPSQTESDHTAGAGELCWITGQGAAGALANSHDVDAGITTLLSPKFDLRGSSTATVSYWRWFRNNAGTTRDGSFRVEASANNGKTWTTLEGINVNPPPVQLGTGTWMSKSFNLASYIALTDSVRIRFTAGDSAANNSVCEAAIDEFVLTRSGCAANSAPVGACTLGVLCALATADGCSRIGGGYQGDATVCTPDAGGGKNGNSCCAADFNSANGVTVQDIFDYLTAWLVGDAAADFNKVNGVTVQDIFDFLTAWLAGC